MRGYKFTYFIRQHRVGVIPWSVLSRIFSDAAAWLESHPQYDAHTAIARVTERMSDRVGLVVNVLFRDAFGAWGGDDGVLMLCFASAFAATGDMESLFLDIQK